MKRAILAIALSLLALSAQAELMIQVTQGRTDAVPIAIVPFAGSADAPQDISGIVRADLHHSGQFKPLSPADMLSRPSNEDELSYRDFSVLDQEYVVLGQEKKTDDGAYEVTYGLYDVAGERRLLSETYRPSADQLRDVAHAISDQIYKKLTGVRGAFSTKIVYVTFNPEADYHYQLQYADADGARVQTILRSNEPIMSPSWSPDGSRIAYVSFENNGWPAIYVHELSSGDRKAVTNIKGSINGAPSFSPNGKRLALTLSKDGNPEIYTLDLGSGKLTRRTNNYAIDTGARWMPDGQHLVFTSGRSGGPQIYELDLRNNKTRRLSFHGKYNARADITPDGRYLVYVHRQSGRYQIAVQDLKRGTFHVVTKSGMDESPSVAPNGSMIIYGTQQHGKGVLEVVSIDGRVKVTLPSKEGEVREPAWSPFL